MNVVYNKLKVLKKLVFFIFQEIKKNTIYILDGRNTIKMISLRRLYLTKPYMKLAQMRERERKRTNQVFLVLFTI